MTLSPAKALITLIWLLAAHAVVAEGPPTQAVRSGKTQTIYRCQIAGVSTFSDHPCGATVEQYDAGLGRLSILGSPAVAVRAVAPGLKRVSPGPGVTAEAAEDAAQAKKAAACQRSRQSLRQIATQMRAGYSAKQGERLRMRKKDVEERRRILGC